MALVAILAVPGLALPCAQNSTSFNETDAANSTMPTGTGTLLANYTNGTDMANSTCAMPIDIANGTEFNITELPATATGSMTTDSSAPGSTTTMGHGKKKGHNKGKGHHRCSSDSTYFICV